MMTGANKCGGWSYLQGNLGNHSAFILIDRVNVVGYFARIFQRFYRTVDRIVLHVGYKDVVAVLQNGFQGSVDSVSGT